MSKDFRGLIAVTDTADVIVISTTEDCQSCDLFINGTGPDDNCVALVDDLDVGLYHVRFAPWSNRTYEGDYDFGIDAYLIEKIGEVPNEFLRKPSDATLSQSEKVRLLK